MSLASLTAELATATLHERLIDDELEWTRAFRAEVQAERELLDEPPTPPFPWEPIGMIFIFTAIALGGAIEHLLDMI